MPVLSINGQQVQVDDSFTGMAPADQQALVNHIASQMQSGSTSSAATAASAPVTAPTGLVPGSAAYAQWAQQQAVAGNKLPQVSPIPPEWQPPADNMPAPLRAFSTGAVESVPVVGALAHNSRDPMMQAIDARAAQQAPGAATAGQVFGSVAPFMVGGEIPGVAKVLGMDAAAGLGAQAAAGAGSMAGLNGIDAALRGQTPEQIAISTGLGALGGAAGPVIGKGVGMAVDAAGNAIGKTAQRVGAVFNPATAQDIGNAAVAKAAVGDIASGQPFLNSFDEADAAANGQPLANIDRYGEGVRTLGRAAGNLSPDAKATLTNMTVPRQADTNQRAMAFIQGQFGDTNSYAAQQGLQNAARAANKPAYLAAYNDPAAGAVFNDDLAQLMQSKAVRDAVRGATSTASNDAALNGFQAVKNPFRFNSDGSYTLAKQADGSTAVPSLQFWDYVQRNLGDNASAATRAGNPAKAGQIGALRTQLNGILDQTVPAFQQARQGAAGFFNAQDALEAGKNFTSMPLSQIQGAQEAFNGMTKPEQKLFQTGVGSSLIDKVGQVTQNRASVIDNIFNTPQAKAQIQMALGDKGTQQMETFLRLEHVMQQSNTAVARNSSTAAQQAAMAALAVGSGYAGGVGSGGGFNPLAWKPANLGSAAGFAAAGRLGARYLNSKVSDSVMTSIAQTLASRDPAAIQELIRNSVRSPQSMSAIKAIERGMQNMVEGASAGAPAVVPNLAPGPGGPEAPTPPLKISVGATPAVQ